MNSNPQGAKEKMLNGYPMDWACTTSGCSHANRFHHDVSGRCTIASCLCRIYSPTPIVPENPNSDKHHLAAKATRLPTSGAPVAPPVAPEGRKGLPMPANPTVLGTCDYVRYELHVHVPTECINWKPQAEPLRESQPSGVEDDGPLSVCAECGMPKCGCGVEGEGPTIEIHPRPECGRECNCTREENHCWHECETNTDPPDFLTPLPETGAPKIGGDLATDLDYQGPMPHVDALSSAPKEIELPALGKLLAQIVSPAPQDEYSQVDMNLGADLFWAFRKNYGDSGDAGDYARLVRLCRRYMTSNRELTASLTRERHYEEKPFYTRNIFDNDGEMQGKDFAAVTEQDFRDLFEYTDDCKCQGCAEIRYILALRTREREKDEEIARLLDVHGADVEALAWHMQRADDLQQRAEKAVEILNDLPATQYCQGHTETGRSWDARHYDAFDLNKIVAEAIALLTAPKENSNAG